MALIAAKNDEIILVGDQDEQRTGNNSTLTPMTLLCPYFVMYFQPANEAPTAAPVPNPTIE